MTNLTPKQEAFCLKYIETGNASEAYRKVYDAAGSNAATINRKAKELLDNGKIAARVEQLQAEHRNRHDVTVDSITAELEAARLLAMQAENPSAAVSAIMGKAKLHGLLTDRQEISSAVDVTDAKAKLLEGLDDKRKSALQRFIEMKNVKPEGMATNAH